MTTLLPESLRSIHCRTTFGLQTLDDLSSISPTAVDNEIIGIVGNRLCSIFCGELQPDGKMARYFFPTHPDALAIKSVILSPCMQFVAASISLDSDYSKLHVAVYAMDPTASLHIRPAIVSHDTKRRLPAPAYFSIMCFSHDAIFLAVCCPPIDESVLVFDWQADRIVQRIPSKGFIAGMSFNPEDHFKLCISGAPALLKYWHFNDRYSNSAPISHPHTASPTTAERTRSYTSHIWLNKHQLIVGSSDGFLTLIKGCDIVQSRLAFPIEEDCDVSVSKLISKADMVVACSMSNMIALFEVVKADKNLQDSSLSLVFFNRFVLGPAKELRGISWAFKSAFSNIIIAASANALTFFELDKAHARADKAVVLSPKEVISRFHSQAIQFVSMPCKSGTFVSASEDETVRVWSLCSRKVTDTVSVKYIDGVGMPVCLDCHPYGRRIAYGCDDSYKELAVTNTKLELMQEFPAKVANQGPNGEAFVNTNPVSKIRYSNAGNLLLVITGRLGQVYNLLELVYDSDVNGTPRRLMVLMDHVTAITDVVFSTDDSRIFTASLDGYIYEWQVGSSHRVREYCFKGMPVTKLVFSASSYIVALVEPTVDVTAASRRMTTRRSSSFSSSSPLFSKDMKKFQGQKEDKKKQFIVMWHGTLAGQPRTIEMDFVITSLAVGTFYDYDRSDFIVFGTSCRDIVVSLLPLPIIFNHSLVAKGSFKAKKSSSQVSDKVAEENRKLVESTLTAENSVDNIRSEIVVDGILDRSLCKILALHNGAVNAITISKSGFWILTAGIDGTISLIGTNKRLGPSNDIPEGVSPESRVGLVDLHFFQKQLRELEDMENRIEDTIVRKDRETAVLKLSTDKRIAELEASLKREVQKRDTIIIQERNENIKRTKDREREFADLKTRDSKELNLLEVSYEKKLAKESQYLDKMRQAYDEFVVHARLDLESAKQQALEKEEAYEERSVSLERDLEKNKEILLSYCDYIGSRYQEVINSVEQGHGEHTTELELQLRDAKNAATSAANESKTHITSLYRDIRNLKQELDDKETHLNRVVGELDWSKEKVLRLEEALQSATTEISRRSDECNKWEFKAGEQQQHLSELERIRRLLVSQLQMVRQELRPREEKLVSVNRELLDGEREYETALQVMTEKQKNIDYQTEKLSTIQRQVRDLRSRLFKKEATLSSAAVLFNEYKTALQKAYFDRKKVTVGVPTAGGPVTSGENDVNSRKSSNLDAAVQNGMVEIILKNKGMEDALARLDHLLRAHNRVEGEYSTADDEEAEQVASEQERHMLTMHRNLRVLKSSLNLTHEVASSKVQVNINQNAKLLEEINSLRQEVISLHRDKQSLIQRLENSEKIRAEKDVSRITRIASENRTSGAVPSTLNMSKSRPPLTDGSDIDANMSRSQRLANFLDDKGYLKLGDNHELNQASTSVSIINENNDESNPIRKEKIALATKRQMNAKDKIDAIFRENQRSIVEAGNDDLSEYSSDSMLDIIAQHMSSTKDASIEDILKPNNSKPKLISGSTTKALLKSKIKMTPDAKKLQTVELILDIKASKSTNSLKFPKV